jgi:hypothetical protein
MTSPTYADAIRRARILDLLAPFDPHVVGTLPLGIALPDSDIDLICHAPDRAAIAELIWAKFGSAPGFAMYQWSARGRPLIARFDAEGWPFEIFASAELVQDQTGWQHFEVERRLLDLGGFALRHQVMALRETGVKTEPAFAIVLGLSGDPYEALIELYGKSDTDLAVLIAGIAEL